MAMKLERLEELYQSMRTQNIIKTRFIFNFRNLQFAVIYIAEQFPHTLLFGCIEHNLFFVLNVNSRYEISTYLGKDYQPLLDALNLKHDPNNPFSPNVFFEEFSQIIPCTTNVTNTPTMAEVAALSRDIEEADKRHFCGWRIHDGVTSNATSHNLSKTLRLCNTEVHNICVTHNISSCWTDDPNRAVPYHAPNI